MLINNLLFLFSDAYIQQMSNQTFIMNMGEYTTPALQKMMRIGVAEGLKRMYKEYRLSKWLKVQEMASTVRQVLSGVDDNNPTPQQSTEVAPWHPQNTPWQMQAPMAYQWQTAGQQFQPPTGPYIHLVSPINSPISNMTLNHHIPGLSENHERVIQVIENPAARKDLFHSNDTENSTNPVNNNMLDCALLDVSGLSDSSDEVLDSVNVTNPHKHSHGNQEISLIYRQPVPPVAPFHEVNTTESLVPFQPPVGNHPFYQQNFENQSMTIPMNHVNHPTMPQYQEADDEPLSDLDDSMDWDSDASSYNDSEESLAGVLFAAEHLLPEEQAERLDVEMGDMGVGHIMFDRVSAVWYKTHCQFFRES